MEYKKVSWELVTEAQQGNEEAFNELFKYIFKLCENYLKKRGVEVHEAEDLASILVIRVYKKLSDLEQKGSATLDNYLFRSAHNIFKTYLRDLSLDGGVHFPFDDEFVSQVSDESSEVIEDIEQHQFFKLILKELTETERRAIILEYIFDASLEESGDEMDITPGAMKSLRHRARKKIRRLLELNRVLESRLHH